MRKVKDFKLKKNITTKELVDQMYEAGGFVAKKVGVGAKILKKMIKDADVNFLSFPADIISTGTRGVIKEMVKRKMFDVIITTCGTLDHDLARIWRDYYHGSFLADDKELHKEHIYRLGNIFIPNANYGDIIEEKLQPIIQEIYEEKKVLSTREFIEMLGKKIKNEKKAKDSIIYWAWKKKIPIYVPGITDGAVGSQLWTFKEMHRDFIIDVLEDEHELANIIWNAKKSGALMIGGGISKHHVIWWNQFKGGLDYAVYITTAPEWDGSLSGARLREAVSWGKVKENAKYVTIEGDATVILPLLASVII